MEFTSENLMKAVLEFYQDEKSINIECHDWLKNCQSSREAWTIIWPLLECNQALNVQFIAANILHHKVSRQLTELAIDDYEALKNNLIGAIARLINGPSVVLTRLQLTLGIFIANTIGPIWPNPLEDLGNLFQPHNFPGIPEEAVIKLLIQVFGYVPEQAQSVWQHSSRKSEAHRELQRKGESMFGWLFGIIKGKQNVEIVKESLRAMIPWMKMLSVCEWTNTTELLDFLVNLCKESIGGGDFPLCELCIEMISGIIADPNTNQYPSVVLLILDKILPLQSTLDIVLELHDMEVAGSFYGMYVALAECHSRLIIEICDEEHSLNKSNPQNRTNVLKLIDILLRCTATPGTYLIDETVSSIPISVWYSFVEDIQQKQSEGLKYARLMQIFEWVYKSLAEILIKKAQFPLIAEDWTTEDREQFRIYRQDVCDCLTYCFELRGWTMLNEMVDIIERQLLVLETNPEKLPQLWPEIESLVMGIRAVTENISNDTDPLLVAPMSRSFEAVLRILKLNQTFRVPQVYQAAAECISSCSGMLYILSDKAKNVIGYILEGLFIPDSASTATLTLKSLSRDCTKLFMEFTPQILTSCRQALDSGLMSQNDSIRLVYCIGKFLPYLPYEQIITAVNEIFAPSLQHLQGIAGDEPKSEVKYQLIVILRIMSTLCSSLDVDQVDSDTEEEEMSELDSFAIGENNNYSSQQRHHLSLNGPGSSRVEVIEGVNPNLRPRKIRDASSQPLIPVVERILPILVPLAEKWSRDEEVMETLFSIVKHTLSTIHNSSQIVIDFAIKLILISFRLHPVNSAVSLSKQTLLMIGRENYLLQCHFLQEIHSLSIQPLKNPRNNLDFAEAYFQFIGQLVRQNPELISGATLNLEPMALLALDILNYTEAPLLKAGIYFVSATVEKVASLIPPLVGFYRNQGPLLLQKLVLAIGCLVPRSVVHYFSEVFLAISRTFVGEWRKWLQNALAPDGFPSPHCTVESKNKFFARLTKERVTKRMITDAVNEFALACRNMSGTEYGSSTSKRVA